MKPVFPTPPLPPCVNTTRLCGWGASGIFCSFCSGMMLPPFDGQDCRPYLKGIGGKESEHLAAGISRAPTYKGSATDFWTIIFAESKNGWGRFSVDPGGRRFSLQFQGFILFVSEE